MDYWQFSDAESYMVDDFYVEYKDGNFSMKNEGASYVKLYGINLGDSMETVSYTHLLGCFTVACRQWYCCVNFEEEEE